MADTVIDVNSRLRERFARLTGGADVEENTPPPATKPTPEQFFNLTGLNPEEVEASESEELEAPELSDDAAAFTAALASTDSTDFADTTDDMGAPETITREDFERALEEQRQAFAVMLKDSQNGVKAPDGKNLSVENLGQYVNPEAWSDPNRDLSQPEEFAKMLNTALTQVRNEVIQTVVAERAKQEAVTQFYSRKENQPLAALRGTKFDPVPEAAAELARTRPDLESATPEKAMAELTKLAHKKLRAMQAAFGVKPAQGGVRKTSKSTLGGGVSRPGGRNPSNNESTRFTDADSSFTSRGLAKHLGRR